MSTSSTVSASSPFLTVDQVGAELSIKPNAVRRLIALRALAAMRTPAADGEWKITPSALAQYVAAGSPRSSIPLVNDDCSAYEDRDLYSFSRQFENDIRDVLFKQFPDACPVANPAAGLSYTLPLSASVAKAVQQLAKQPALWWSRMPNAVKSPFPNRAAQFLGAKLLELAWAEATPSTDDAVKGASTWLKLFDSPQAFRSCVDTSWSKMMGFRIVISREYALADLPGSTCRTFYEVPYSFFGIALADVEPLVF